VGRDDELRAVARGADDDRERARPTDPYKTSGPWFLAAAACIGLGVVLTLVGVEVVAAVPFLTGIVLLFLGMHKHSKAGGDDTTVWHGMNIAD